MSNISLTKAILIFITTIITTIITVYGHLPLGFLSIISCFVLIYVEANDIYKTSILRLMGAAIGVAMIMICSKIFLPSSQIGFCIISIALIFITSYFYTNATFTAYGFIISILTIALMANFSLLSEESVALKFGMFWVLNILISIVLSSLLIFLNNILFQKNSIPQENILTNKNKLQLYRFNKTALLVAFRVTISLVLVSIINWKFNVTEINLQALLAVTVVSCQRSTKNAYSRAWHRSLGILIGCLLAILYFHIYSYFHQIWLLVILLAIVFSIASIIRDYFNQAFYIILQAVIMIPIVSLYDINTIFDSSLMYERSFGTIEGAIIATIIFYIVHMVGKNIKN